MEIFFNVKTLSPKQVRYEVVGVDNRTFQRTVPECPYDGYGAHLMNVNLEDAYSAVCVKLLSVL